MLRLLGLGCGCLKCSWSDQVAFYQPRRKAPSFSYGDIRLAPAWLC
uniref:OMP406 n=1 Tax=Helicobacter bizzozeronii TaxID=56877 RepID=A0A1M4NH27_HELBI|nr:OMP406 [Helicobacter bizzozeronii]